MNYDLAICCASAIGPGSDRRGRHFYEALRKARQEGLRSVVFTRDKPERGVFAELSPAVTFVQVDPATSAVILGPQKLPPHVVYAHALGDTLITFLRAHSIAAIEFPDTHAEGCAFVSHNLVYRAVPLVAVRLFGTAFLQDDEAGRPTCSITDSLVYAAEREVITLADRILCDEPALLDRTLACFPASAAAKLRDRVSADSPAASRHIAPSPTPPAPAKPVGLGVVIPHLDDVENLGALLERLQREGNGQLEIVVVDDGSPPSAQTSLASLRSRHPGTTFLQTPAPRSGPFLARLQGLRAIRSDYVAFVDADDYIDVDRYLAYAQAISRTPALEVILPALRWSGKKTHTRIPPPKALFTAFVTGFAHTGLVGRKAPIERAFTHAYPTAKDIAHGEDCLLAISMLFLGTSIICMPECAYHYNRMSADTRSLLNPQRFPESKRAREAHVDRCLGEALLRGELAPIDLRIIRRLAAEVQLTHAASLPVRGVHVPWHTHLYRAFRSLIGDPRYR